MDAAPHAPEEPHAGPSVTPYLVVFGLLTAFTIVSFAANEAARHEAITTTTSFWIILGAAVIKALLVVWYFMHLNHDWNKVFLMLVPAALLAGVFIVVLWPDGVLIWHEHATESPAREATQ